MDQTITLKINLDKLKEHLTLLAQDGYGLEDNAGRTPTTLDDGLDFLQQILPSDQQELITFLYTILDLINEVHEESVGDVDED
jgi:hypothetical protein